MKVAAVVIGAGHAGLAMSRCLSERSIDHVVLERGSVANSWKTERWDSLTLLTPNWQTRLPGFAYGGDEPDGYMSGPEVARLIDDMIETMKEYDGVGLAADQVHESKQIAVLEVAENPRYPDLIPCEELMIQGIFIGLYRKAL
jgi:glycine/D-amino acid oxidase-like deaminating enzyme